MCVLDPVIVDTVGVCVCVFLWVQLSKNVLLAGNGGKERQAERKRGMEKQLQLPPATQPAGILFKFFLFSPLLSARSVKTVGYVCQTPACCTYL